ncbi:hypothetical protein RFI_24776, partial [Reticulomyxa filosa]
MQKEKLIIIKKKCTKRSNNKKDENFQKNLKFRQFYKIEYQLLYTSDLLKQYSPSLQSSSVESLQIYQKNTRKSISYALNVFPLIFVFLYHLPMTNSIPQSINLEAISPSFVVRENRVDGTESDAEITIDGNRESRELSMSIVASLQAHITDTEEEGEETSMWTSKTEQCSPMITLKQKEVKKVDSNKSNDNENEEKLETSEEDTNTVICSPLLDALSPSVEKPNKTARVSLQKRKKIKDTDNDRNSHTLIHDNGNNNNIKNSNNNDNNNNNNNNKINDKTIDNQQKNKALLSSRKVQLTQKETNFKISLAQIGTKELNGHSKSNGHIESKEKRLSHDLRPNIHISTHANRIFPNKPLTTTGIANQMYSRFGMKLPEVDSSH